MTSEMFQFFLTTFLSGILFLLFIYCIGHLILKIVNSGKLMSYNMAQSIFVKTLLGLFFVIISTAIFCTKGKTIFLVPLVGFFVAHLFLKRNEIARATIETGYSFKEELKSASITFIISIVIVYMLVFWTSFSVESFPYFSLSRDDIFYAQVANHISVNGVENIYLDWGVKAKEMGICPYHYFDPYLMIFFSSFLNITNNHILWFISFPVMLVVLVTGVMSFYKGDRFSMLFVAVLSIIVFQFFKYDFKLISCTIIFTLVTLFYFNNEYSKAIFALVVLPALNWGQLPLVLAVILILLIISIFKKQFTYFKSIGLAIIICLSYFITIGAFKGTIDGLSSDIGMNSITDYYFTDLSRIKTSIHIALSLFIEKILENVFQFVFLMALFGLIIVMNKFKAYRKFIYLIGIYLILSLILSGLFSFLADTAQIFYLYFTFLMFLPFILATKLIGDNKLFKIAFTVFSIVALYGYLSKYSPRTNQLYFDLEKYSSEYLNELKLNKGTFKGRGARFMDANINSAYAINPNCHNVGYPLTFLRNGMEINTLNLLDIKPIESLHDFFNYNKAHVIKSTYLSHDYYQSEKQLSWNQLDSNGKSAYYINFINRHQIKYVFVNAQTTIPESVRVLFKHKIMDLKSGEYVLYKQLYE